MMKIASRSQATAENSYLGKLAFNKIKEEEKKENQTKETNLNKK